MILVISSKKAYATRRLVYESRIQNLEYRIMEAQELVELKFKIDIKPYDCLYIRNPYIKGSAKYLPEMVKLAKKFKEAGKKVVDANIANGELGDGKWEDYKKLAKAGLPVPKTELLKSTHYPLPTTHFVAKWIYGFKGDNVFLINSREELKEVLKKYPKKELLRQEYIKADYEYKVMTVGYETVPVVLRFDIKDSGFKLEHNNYEVISWRHPFGKLRAGSEAKAEGSKSKRGILHSVQDDAIARVISLAQKAAKLLGRELSKIDILQQGSNLYILEVNRYPGLESFEKLTKYNVTKDIVKYLSC